VPYSNNKSESETQEVIGRGRGDEWNNYEATEVKLKVLSCRLHDSIDGADLIDRGITLWTKG
jgi:hypothetical protein